jgi:hypothetical protein
MKSGFGLKAAAAALFAVACAFPAFGDVSAVSSLRIDQFQVGSPQRDFGRLEFLGGLEMTTADGALGAWSSIRIRPDQAHFVGVLDTGDWITGKIMRDGGGRLSGVQDLKISPMLDKNGRPNAKKWLMDSESLALRKGEVLVGFEGRHRVDVYPDPGFETSKPMRSLPKLIPDAKLVGNKSLETTVVAPANGPLAGSPVIVSEESLNKEGNMYAAVLEGPRKGIFFVKRHEPFDITDGTFLPDGDLLLLERSFGLLQGIGMRMRLVHADDIKPGATVDGEELIKAGIGTQIDNMEGVDSFLAPDGSVHLILVSDDNHSLLQRNLMLEFRLKN